MKPELTKKDIFLLKLALSILLVFLCFRFLIMPGITNYQEKLLEAEELAETRTEMEAAIESVPLLEQTIENRRQQRKEASASYYARMENRQIDEILTGLAVKLGLFPVSLTIQNAEPGIPEPYLYAKSDSAKDVSATDAAETAEGEARAEEAEEVQEEQKAQEELEAQESGNTSAAALETSGYILTGTGSFTMRGTQEQMFLFVDELEQNYPAVHVRAMQMNQRVFLDADWDVVEELEATFELEIYMYEE